MAYSQPLEWRRASTGVHLGNIGLITKYPRGPRRPVGKRFYRGGQDQSASDRTEKIAPFLFQEFNMSNPDRGRRHPVPLGRPARLAVILPSQLLESDRWIKTRSPRHST